MSFPGIATRVLQAKGYDITEKEIKSMSPFEICRITGLPRPSNCNNGKKRERNKKIGPPPMPVKTFDSVDVFFEGFDKKEDTETCHLHVDQGGLEHTLKCMDNPDEIVIPKNTIRVKYEFEFDDGPYFRVIRNSNKKGLTRKDVAVQLARHYQKFFKNRAKYGLWVKDISSIGISAISYNHKEKVYELNVDLTQ